MRTAARTSYELPNHGKISPEFSARLGSIGPDKKLHAIILLRGPEPSRKQDTRPSPAQRRTTIEETRATAKDALDEIDKILKGHGRRLSEEPTALGTIPVESTPTGILSLAKSPYVRAILEDQSVSRILGRRPA